MSQLIQLTGIDPNSPKPGSFREIRTNQGPSGGFVPGREAVILCNKLASVGSASVDGKGDALNTPVLVTDEADVIARCGRKSEGLLLWRTFRRSNPATTPLYLDIVPPGTGTATCDFAFATTPTGVGRIRIDSCGESEYVSFDATDTVTTVAARVKDKINEIGHWPIAASNVSGVLTTAASWAGTRGDHYVNKLRITIVTSGIAMTVTKGSVTGGGADDDQTTAISGLNTLSYFYQVNPKVVTSAVTSTDNGIGEHMAALAQWVAPQGGKEQVVYIGQVGTPSQATAVAISMNSEWSKQVCAEGSDWSPGMLAAHHCGACAYKEASHPGARMTGYGRNSGDLYFVPAPFAVADRVTEAEIITLLNNGCTVINFTTTGRGYIERDVTTKSLHNGATDYKARSGHIPSVCADFVQLFQGEANAVMQPFVADDWSEGQRPIPQFSTPKDIKEVGRRCIGLRTGEGQFVTLDPSQIDAMVASLTAERQANGLSLSVGIAAVRHNDKRYLLVNETSPSI